MRQPKTLAWTLVSICSTLLFSCSKEEVCNSNANEPGQVVFHAFDAENNDRTKTVLSGTSVLWSPGDEIMVYQGTKSSVKFTSTATAPCAATDFSGSLPYIVGGQESLPENSNIWAVYPYSAACGCDGNSVTLSVNAVQTAKTGTFASGLFPSIAKSNNYSLAFYNVCGGLKFTVAQDGIKKVVLKGNNSEKLAGKVNVGFSAGYPVINNITESVDSIIVNAPIAAGFIPGDEYFIVSIPAVFSKGYSIRYINDYGISKYVSVSSVQLKRKTFGVVSRKDTVGILFRDKNAKAACVARFDKNGDGECSFSEAAAATSLNGLFEDYDDVQYFPELKYFTSVTDLQGCFTNCANLKEIAIPSFITAIGDKAFYGCSSLTIIEIPSNVLKIGNEAFRNCTSLSNVVFNEGLSSLGPRAFYSIGAKTVTLPASIATIGTRAFWNEVETIYMKGTTPPSIAEVSFGTNTIFYVPDEALSTYKNAANWHEFEENIYSVSSHFQFVDLGLSVKWATMNVGANAVTDYGNHFAWGEVTPKSSYTWSTYKYCKGNYNTLTKYCSSYGNNGYTDTKRVLDAEDDAATVNWGSSWRIPTKEEFIELKENCSWMVTTINSTTVMKVTSKISGYGDAYIIFPFGGYYTGNVLNSQGTLGCYWTSTLYSISYYAVDSSWRSNSGYDSGNCSRCEGRSIRPVLRNN